MEEKAFFGKGGKGRGWVFSYPFSFQTFSFQTSGERGRGGLSVSTIGGGGRVKESKRNRRGIKVFFFLPQCGDGGNVTKNIYIACKIFDPVEKRRQRMKC